MNILSVDQPQGTADKRHPFGSNKFPKSHHKISHSELNVYVTAVQSVDELHHDVSLQLEEICRKAKEPATDSAPFDSELCEDESLNLATQQLVADMKSYIQAFLAARTNLFLHPNQDDTIEHKPHLATFMHLDLETFEDNIYATMTAIRQAAMKLIHDPESRRQVEVHLEKWNEIKPLLDDTFKTVNATAELRAELDALQLSAPFKQFQFFFFILLN